MCWSSGWVDGRMLGSLLRIGGWRDDVAGETAAILLVLLLVNLQLWIKQNASRLI